MVVVHIGLVLLWLYAGYKGALLHYIELQCIWATMPERQAERRREHALLSCAFIPFGPLMLLAVSLGMNLSGHATFIGGPVTNCRRRL